MKESECFDETNTDDFLLDLNEGDSPDSLKTLWCKPSIFYSEGETKESISNHYITPIGEVLYHISGEWIDHRRALLKKIV